MNNQRGFLPVTGYVALGMGAVILALGLALRLQTARADAAERDLATFTAQVEANGKAAEAEAKRKEAENKAQKEKIDRENKTLRANLAAAHRKLRDNRAASGYVPPAAPGSASPDVAAFDRAKLESAIQRLDAEVSELIERGDEAVTDLNSARAWARK